MKFYIVIILYICFIINLVKANEDNPEPILSEDEVKKLSIKVLRSKLRIRGLECKGCAEKQDYVKMFMENQHLPVIDHQKNPKNEPQKKKMKDKEMEDLMEKLKQGGFGGAQMFSADDLKDLSPEELAAKMGGGYGRGYKNQRKSKGSTSNDGGATRKSKQSADMTEENIEL